MNQNLQQGYQQGLYNQQGLCSSGRNSPSGDGWRPISDAPRDGTIIEVRCTYGVAPWYGLYRWTSEMRKVGQDGQVHVSQGQQPRWAKVGDDCMGFSDGPSFTWRASPQASTQNYVDPTGGAQDDPAYWRGAAAARMGQPADYFEPKPPGLFTRIMRAHLGPNGERCR